MPQLVNLRLMSHPFNWAFVWITLAITAFAYKLVHDAITASPDEETSAGPVYY